MSAAGNERQGCVAVVDDDEESASILQEFLESKGVPAEPFSDAEALLAATPRRFAAVLLDINLPGMSGSECGYELRRRGYRGPIIAFSGDIERWDPEDLHDLGFTCALGKPLEPTRLLELLQEHIMRSNKASSGASETSDAIPPLDAQSTVRDLVVRHPALRRELEKLGIDYCCGGAVPIAEAARAAGQAFSRTMAALESAMRTSAEAETAEVVDWSKASATKLADYIEREHHAFTTKELPRLEELFGRVLRAHGEKHGAMLRHLHATFLGLKGELEAHLLKEEQILFPYIRRIETLRAAGGPKPVGHCEAVQNPIRQLEIEHKNAGEALARMRETSSGYALPADGCPTFAALFEGLVALEADLHEHIHLENNILFPKAMGMGRAKDCRQV